MNLPFEIKHIVSHFVVHIGILLFVSKLIHVVKLLLSSLNIITQMAILMICYTRLETPLQVILKTFPYYFFHYFQPIYCMETEFGIYAIKDIKTSCVLYIQLNLPTGESRDSLSTRASRVTTIFITKRRANQWLTSVHSRV